jgi:hypothetical protein
MNSGTNYLFRTVFKSCFAQFCQNRAWSLTQNPPSETETRPEIFGNFEFFIQHGFWTCWEGLEDDCVCISCSHRGKQDSPITRRVFLTPTHKASLWICNFHRVLNLHFLKISNDKFWLAFFFEIHQDIESSHVFTSYFALKKVQFVELGSFHGLNVVWDLMKCWLLTWLARLPTLSSPGFQTPV